VRVNDPDAGMWACNRKKAYRTQKFAEKLAARIRAGGENVVAYGCTRCGEWHIGHELKEDHDLPEV
jgi:hypothetical protein